MTTTMPFFVTELKPQDYPALENSDFGGPMRWDFSGGDPITYRAEQSIRDRDQGEFKTMEVTSTIRFEPKGASAQVSMQLLSTSSPDELPPGAQIVSRAFRDDSTHVEELHDMAWMLPVFFALPPDVLAEGAELATPMELPIRFMGKQEFLRGTITTKFSRLVELDGSPGAEIFVTLTADDFSLVEQPASYGETFITGQGVIYFDIEQRRVHKSDVALRLNIDFSKSPLAEQGLISETTMLQDHFIRINVAP